MSTVVCARTPTLQGRDGRDHHPHAFSMWMAGGGVKAGSSYGVTDDHIHDLHATILELLGLDLRGADVPARRSRFPAHGCERAGGARPPGLSHTGRHARRAAGIFSWPGCVLAFRSVVG